MHFSPPSTYLPFSLICPIYFPASTSTEQVAAGATDAVAFYPILRVTLRTYLFETQALDKRCDEAKSQMPALAHT